MKGTLAMLLLAGCAAKPPAPAAGERQPRFDQREVMIPMRDGKSLQTLILTPKGSHGKLPFIFERDPYGQGGDGQAYDDLVADGYILVFQSLRGRFKSEGDFVVSRPLCAGAAGCIDEATDAYDSITWLLANQPDNNGKVGMIGVSYSALTSVMALSLPHPALSCIVEMASPVDQFLGDDFHHNGVFRLSYAFDYTTLLESERGALTLYPFPQFDTYEFYLALGPLSTVDKTLLVGKMPSWRGFAEHPSYDDFWKAQSLLPHLAETKVPTLNVDGFWDQEDMWGPQEIYRRLEQADGDRHLNYFVAGPWNHGGWMVGPGRRLGGIDFGADTGTTFRREILAPWLRHFLHGSADPLPAEATVYQTGSQSWKKYGVWPPRDGIDTQRLFFGPDHKLSFDPPGPDGGADSYLADPANPVPYRRRPISPSFPAPDWQSWRVQDQRFVDHRPDVLSYVTDPLTKPVEVVGDVVADLYAATTGTDADWVVKLIDVLPEDAVQPSADGKDKERVGGYQLTIVDEIVRARFRDSFETPTAVPAGKPLEYKIDLHLADHVFGVGHRIMVQVQSSWFPLYDRNPQTFVPNLFTAKAEDFVPAKQTILRTAAMPSAVILPVVTH